MRVLGIETSCDETAASVVEAVVEAVVESDGPGDGAPLRGRVLSDVVRSQIALHATYGGVVPELASREHARFLEPVVREALDAAGCTLSDLGGIAVTCRPGLAGALLVGLQAAKGLAFGSGKPLVGVDHLVGHLLAIFLERPAPGGGPPSAAPDYPFLGLLVSGGHTALYRVEGPRLEEVRELGATRDDAAGEAFDKAGKLLGLGYPGGPAIDRLAAGGDPSRAPGFVPPGEPLAGSLEFSFSGMKTALARGLAGRAKPEDRELADICAAFQQAAVSALVKKTLRAAKQEGLSRVVLAGGVAANRGLRASMASACASRGLELFVPDFRSCTDNAAMIAYAGLLRLQRGERDGLDLAPSTRTELLRVTRKGGGRRVLG